jgi:hypothetical protein
MDLMVSGPAWRDSGSSENASVVHVSVLSLNSLLKKYASVSIPLMLSSGGHP